MMVEQSVVERLSETVAAIRQQVAAEPTVGVVLGSGLGAFADTLTNLVKVSYDAVPHMPRPRVPGHAGNFCFGRVGTTSVVCMQGRVHLYEGHPAWQVVHGARTMARLGVRSVLITNAAGALDSSWTPGDVMAIVDHINLTGCNPLVGPNDDTLGTRFPDMTAAYHPDLRLALVQAAREQGLVLREGIYAGLLGPTYETPAEVRMLQGFGAHAVGMSTVCEVIALRHMGIRVGALSCITNLAAGLGKGHLSHAEVEALAVSRRGVLVRLLERWVTASALE